MDGRDVYSIRCKIGYFRNTCVGWRQQLRWICSSFLTTLLPSIIICPPSCAAFFLVYLRSPPLDPTFPSQPLSSIISTVDQNRIPALLVSTPSPSKSCLPPRTTWNCGLSSCSRVCSLFISSLYLILWEDQFFHASLNNIQKKRKCGRNIRNKGMWMDKAKENKWERKGEEVKEERRPRDLGKRGWQQLE